MKNLACLTVFACLAFSTASSGINAYKSGDTLYVWAYHGLNLRTAPSAAAAKRSVTPYGAALLVLDSVKVKAFHTTEYGGYRINGYWTKVCYGSLEGWVFDGYLSKYPALRYIKHPQRNNPEAEDFLEYARREWKLTSHKRLDLEKDLPATDTLSCRDIFRFKNGAIIKIARGRGDGGWTSYAYSIPDFSFEECFLFFIYNSGFYLYDPTYHPEYAREVDIDSSGNSIQRTATSVRIEWGLCHFTFKKKKGTTTIEWYCSC